MFWYQCRYCKNNFNHWGKLVTHRRDEHSREFEALKRRSALLLRKQEEAVTIHVKSGLEESVNNNNDKTVKKALSAVSRNMKPTTSRATSSLSPRSTTPRKQSQSSTKELDAKDLENQEISLCVSPITQRCSPASLSFARSKTPPFSFPTPTSSPRINGNVTPKHRNRTACNGNNGHSSENIANSFASLSSFLTPPVTPSRSSSATVPSPLLSAEELAPDWSPPADFNKAVQYDQMSDEVEIEICAIPPSAGSCISVTKHFPLENRMPPRIKFPPLYMNGNGKSGASISSGSVRDTGRQPLIRNSHIVIENFEDEVTMSCSNGIKEKATKGTTNCKAEKAKSRKASHTSLAISRRRKSHVEMLQTTGQQLKSLHSQLQQRQTRGLLTSRSSPKLLPANLIRRAAMKLRASHSTNNSTGQGGNAGPSHRRCSSAVNTSANIPRINNRLTRASTRRPK